MIFFCVLFHKLHIVQSWDYGKQFIEYTMWYNNKFISLNVASY